MDEPFKRYMVFGEEDYYPSGGLGDCRGSFDTLDEAREFAKKLTCDTVYLFDRVEGVSCE